MNTNQVDKEVYRGIIRGYFTAFATRDFSRVQFSSKIEFLSPISGITMKGREAVSNFVSGVSTRVVAVNIVSITVDYPTASGVWQMTTSKGITFTLNNFFRLDEEGLAYIWPMFDPKMVIEHSPDLLQWLRGADYYEVAATTLLQPTGVSISAKDRLFVNFPRLADTPAMLVGEIGANGSVSAYPNEEINHWDGKPGESAKTHFICVQTVHVDRDDNLWILDPASPAHKGVVEGGAKLVKVNLSTNAVEDTYSFGYDIAPQRSFLNKMRVANGYAFITDSDLGALIVLNLRDRKARRLLDNHYSTKAEAGVSLAIDGRPLKFPPVHSDGIAIDATFECIYYKSLIGRMVYRVPVRGLLDESLSAEALDDLVEPVAVTESSGGMEFDAKGNLYLACFQADAIKVLKPDGRFEFFARATDFLWPDTITVSREGDLLFSASQLHLMPVYNNGVDGRTPPYKIFRLRLPG